MCGRFALSAKTNEIEKLAEGLKADFEFEPRYNIAPTESVAVALNDSSRNIVMARWGLIPSWAKDTSMSARLINARSETITEKPMFRSAFAKRRCIVFADGYYEWQSQPDSKIKQPYFIHKKNGSPFVFAGLWDVWKNPDGCSVLSTTIITTHPNALLETIHHRMPCILKPDDIETWLMKNLMASDVLLSCLVSYPFEEMEAYPVSKRVNNPSYNESDCVTKL